MIKKSILGASLFSNYNLLRTYQSPLSFLIIHFFNHESPVIPPHYPLFTSVNVQFYSPMSTFFIYECPVLFPNVHFFIYECPVLYINKKTRYKNFFLFRVRIFLSFCEFYKFGSILNLYFPFPYPSTFSISSCTSISFIISDALDVFSFVTSITSFLPNTESKLNLS